MPTVIRHLLALVLLGTLAGAAPAPTGPAPGARLPGKFIWFNLATPDAYVAKAFYGAVFGWNFIPPPEGGKYLIIQHDGRDIGGLVVPAANSKVKGSRWISLLSVADAAKAAHQAEAHGGTVLIRPTAVAQRGTHALLRDAEGALFGILQSITPDPSDELEANEFFWADLLTSDAAKAADFYHAVGGYEASQATFGTRTDRVTLSAGGVKRASITPMPKEMKQPGWLPYVVVNDVPATLELVIKAGGRVLLPPDPAVHGGQLAIFADPSGGVLGIAKWVAPAKDQGTP